MRGKPHATRPGAQTIRNIPAYAGKTIQAWSDELKALEHPRVCGENVIVSPRRLISRGTSPRMRGKLGNLC